MNNACQMAKKSGEIRLTLPIFAYFDRSIRKNEKEVQKKHQPSNEIIRIHR